MRINSKYLWHYIWNLDDDELPIRFKVYKNDVYTGTIIKWDGKDFWWKPGTFQAGLFYDCLCNFELIEKNKKIEKMPYYDYTKIVESTNKSKTIELMLEKHEKRINDMHKKINKLIDEINKLKENNECKR